MKQKHCSKRIITSAASNDLDILECTKSRKWVIYSQKPPGEQHNEDHAPQNTWTEPSENEPSVCTVRAPRRLHEEIHIFVSALPWYLNTCQLNITIMLRDLSSVPHNTGNCHLNYLQGFSLTSLFLQAPNLDQYTDK